MARYFFHLHESETVTADGEGQECATLGDAIDLATLTARDVMIGELREGRLCLGWSIEIADGDGAEVHRVRFRDAVDVMDIRQSPPPAD